jgi:rRNA maturation protein Nop10
MIKLNKCPLCNNYTLKEKCIKCNSKTKEISYKFNGLKDEEH